MSHHHIKELLEKRVIEERKVPWGKGFRNVIIINEKRYQYNGNNISINLKNKILLLYISRMPSSSNENKVAQEIKKVYLKARLNNALKRYAIKNFKAEINEGESHFQSYLNNTIISNINLKGLKGLTYVKYQEEALIRFLNKKGSMKLLIEAVVVFDQLDEEGHVVKEFIRTLNSRRYDIFNKDDLKEALNAIPGDIELQIQERYLQKSGLRVKGVEKININYDKFNPTRGGSYIQTPEWIANKKACINIRNEDSECLKYSIQCDIHGIHEKKNPQEMRHYKGLQDDIIIWDGVKFPAGNKDIDCLELINKGILSVNVYEETFFSDKKQLHCTEEQKL
jgi:hypothetical protein